MDHGRQPVEMITREKYLSSFHLYPTTSDLEIDCISVRESLLAGVIPLISNSGVFKERDGIHFEMIDINPVTFAQIGLNILEIMKRSDLDTFRESLRMSASLVNWNDVAMKWMAELFTSP
jgi:hypothetical protein